MPLDHLLPCVTIGQILLGFLTLGEALPLRRVDLHNSIITQAVVDQRSIDRPAEAIRRERREEAEYLLHTYHLGRNQ